MVPRSSDNHIDLMTSVSVDVIDVDGEAAIAALEDVRAEGERLQ